MGNVVLMGNLHGYRAWDVDPAIYFAVIVTMDVTRNGIRGTRRKKGQHVDIGIKRENLPRIQKMQVWKPINFSERLIQMTVEILA